MPIFFSPDFNDVAMTSDTFVKAVALYHHLDRADLGGVSFRAPTPLSATAVGVVHDPAYVEAVLTGDPRHLAESNGLGWDPGLFHAAATSSGGIVDAALHVLEHGGVAGSLSSGLHHARHDEGAGFCTFNGLVLAARRARDAGAARVLILDLDAHCGGGTASLIEDLDGIEQVDVSVSSFDRYAPTDRVRLTMSRGATYLDDVERALASVTNPSTLDLVLYNAGMDPHTRAGGVAGITTDVLAAREAMVFDWATANRLPLAWVPAGGYRSEGFDLDDVCGLHRLTVEAGLAALSRAD